MRKSSLLVPPPAEPYIPKITQDRKENLLLRALAEKEFYCVAE